jgi:hypothetical protein
MLYSLLYALHTQYSFFNVFRYITFRAILAILTALVISFFLGPWVIRKLKELQVKQYIREDGPKNHREKEGTFPSGSPPSSGPISPISSSGSPSWCWGGSGRSASPTII